MPVTENAAKFADAANVGFGQWKHLENTLGDPSLELAECVLEEVELAPPPASDVDDGAFDRLTEAGKILTDDVLARFKRPDLEHPSMLYGEPEYFRWYFADEKPRERPLDFDELVQLIDARDRCGLEEAERQVCLYSQARQGDQEIWTMIQNLGYGEYLQEFCDEVYDLF